MGKSPGKWIKSLILGRKSSKSKLSRGNDVSKSAGKGAILISSEAPVSDTTADNSISSQSDPAIGPKSGVDSEPGAAAKLQNEALRNEGFTFSSAQRDENTEEVTTLGSEKDPERIRHETAVTKAQAAARGYLARRAFRTLKGIIRLQALIRGHLVRRQAIAMLHCIHAIVKVQALVRGQRVRHSTVGIEVQKACNMGKIQGTKCSDSSGVSASTPVEKLIKNVFVQKLLASAPGAKAHSIHYCPVEPNTSWEWLERWTRSHFQQSSHLQPKINVEHDTVKKKETEKGRRKRSVQKVPLANAENSSGRSTKVSERPKRKPRKFPSQPIYSVEEHPQNEFEEVNHNFRKASDSTRDAHERFDVDSGKPKSNLKKLSTSAAPEFPQGANDMAVVLTKESSHDDSSPKQTALQERHDLDLQPTENNTKVHDIHGTIKQLNTEDYHTGNENHKISERRASFPPNIEQQENGIHNTPKMPSYMAPTESARAKLRGNGSPRVSQGAIENMGTTRRHSLPSSTNGKFPSMSPRVQKLVHAAGKGVISQSSSRDDTVSDKAIKAEWRR